MTLLELLVAAGLLALLTATLGVAFVTVLRQSRPLDQRQQVIQRGILFQRQLEQTLRQGELVDFTGTAIRYHPSRRARTAYGDFHQVGLSQMLDFDRTVTRAIRLELDHRIVDGVPGQPETERILWILGSEGSLSIEARKPFLHVQVAGRLVDGDPDSARFQKSYLVYVKGLP